MKCEMKKKTIESKKNIHINAHIHTFNWHLGLKQIKKKEFIMNELLCASWFSKKKKKLIIKFNFIHMIITIVKHAVCM